MIEPSPPRQVAQPQTQQPAPQNNQGGNALENALNQLLRDILGRN
jgi:hypothetical protein